MQKLSGKSVYSGIAMGPVLVLKKADGQVERGRAEDVEAEIAKVNRALGASREQLQKLYEKAVTEVGEEQAAIFEAHQMIMEDEDFLDAIFQRIRTEQVNAEYAVALAGDHFAQMFADMEDDYMRARSADIRDIANRLIRNLKGGAQADAGAVQPSIIVADDLTPSETVQMDKEKILAFVTVQGSTNSHTAILARTMNIPALIGVPVDMGQIRDGMTAIVDGAAGEVTFEPTAEICREAEKKIAQEKEKAQLLAQLKGKENITQSGRKVDVYANIGGVDDVEYVLENDAGGIGLFRSEFLYLGRDGYPSEEEQYQAYTNVLRAMGDKKVIIRTLDIGADKKVDYFGLDREENPALGYRAIRICLKQPDIFKTQLRALLRASVCGNPAILYPMIISAEEVQRIYQIVSEVSRELDEAQIPHKVPEQGVMIETPAAVMISEELAQLVDFFSIGTNDLTQYTLAIDRQNQRLEDFYDPHHPAVLRMIQMAVDSAHKYGKWVGICGELGADLELTETLVQMGVDELSVSPSMVLPLRKRIRELR